jgi:hypothetical protein
MYCRDSLKGKGTAVLKNFIFSLKYTYTRISLCFSSSTFHEFHFLNTLL